jgi:diguanylate cyclase (GGDEF)-like protein
MVETTLDLNRISIAVQMAVVLTILAYFILLGRMVRLREVLLWQFSWLADAIALAAVFVHAYVQMPEIGHQVARVIYVGGKTVFAVLMVSGARHHLRPGVLPTIKIGPLLVVVAIWSTAIGFPSAVLGRAQLAQSLMVGTIFVVGGMTVLVRPRSPISRWLGWALIVEGVLFLHYVVALAPLIWGAPPGLSYMTYSSFFDAWAELMLALACTAVLADHSEELVRYANRELLQSQQRLSRLVDTDPLTGLANRRSLRRELNSASETGAAVIFIDINRFKQVNDLFGHVIGDITLQRMARLIEGQFRPEDHVIRWGGDEFLVIAPGMDQVSAKSRLAAINEALRHPDADGPRFSFAAGVAELFPGGDPTAALEEADRRMYAEKQGQ